MALTRDFKETVLARAQRGARFREALFTEAINAYLAGDTTVDKAVLRDLVNATIGFEGLAAEVNKPSKSLHRMLAPRGNPNKLLRHRESITEKDAREASRDGQSGLTYRIAEGVDRDFRNRGAGARHGRKSGRIPAGGC